ncbi:hypothetical protein IQ277_33925 [Nostocales cyanobacterium LEGE 12452]|nr:hypothetical protein [Nostocales cyanobacterium LEGE 12452]
MNDAYSRLQLLYERLRQGEVQIIVGAQHVVPLPVYFIYLKYAVFVAHYAVCVAAAFESALAFNRAIVALRMRSLPMSWFRNRVTQEVAATTRA